MRFSKTALSQFHCQFLHGVAVAGAAVVVVLLHVVLVALCRCYCGSVGVYPLVLLLGLGPVLAQVLGES